MGQHEVVGQAAGRMSRWVYLLIGLSVISGGCGSPEVQLSKAGQACKAGLLREMALLTTALAGPVAQQDWDALQPILQNCYGRIEREGGFVPFRIVVLDQNGIVQAVFPESKQGKLDFSNYDPTRMVYAQKRKVQALLYLEGKKIFIFMAPVLHNHQVSGAVVMGFPEEALEKWQVSEKEFLSIDFNN
jgi:hypothetical protein|uniref:Double Cache domain-containing protein n=1 Tax=Desulfobacca acetoxidans TaxID=60893 RepID=A0A7C3Z3A4_9BACT